MTGCGGSLHDCVVGADGICGLLGVSICAILVQMLGDCGAIAVPPGPDCSPVCPLSNVILWWLPLPVVSPTALQAAQGSAAAIQLPFPVPLLPTDSDEVHSDDEQTMAMSEQPTPGGPFRRSGSGQHISPPKSHRGGSGGAPGPLPAMFQQQLSSAAAAAAQAQQQQMQAAHMAQMQAAMAMQQQQQQQQAGFGFPGQPPYHH